MSGKPLVGIVMGSDSDLEVMTRAKSVLDEFGVSSEMTIASAHRTPDKAAEYAKTAKKNGMKVIIAGAGYAAHLAGVLAAHTTLPVIGVPLEGSSFNGFDSLLAMVQMPSGIPVATVTVGKAGGKNAGLLAIQMLALSDEGLSDKLEDYKVKMAKEVEEKNKKIS